MAKKNVKIQIPYEYKTKKHYALFTKATIEQYWWEADNMGDVKQIKHLFRFVKGHFSIVYTTKRTDTEWYRYC